MLQCVQRLVQQLTELMNSGTHEALYHGEVFFSVFFLLFFFFFFLCVFFLFFSFWFLFLGSRAPTEHAGRDGTSHWFQILTVGVCL